MPDQLHQFNINYVPVEDRILLRINTLQGDEFRFWLTRRYTGILVERLAAEMEKHGGAPALAAQPATTRLFKEGAMEKPYAQEKVVNHPLGTQAILASRLKLRATDQGGLVAEILPEQGPGITLHLNKTLLFMLYNLLSQGCEQSGWRLGREGPGQGKVH